MQLSKRLNSVASLVTPNNRVADVGCDHAYTSIFLVEQKRVPFVIAMDINEGPLERARENIKRSGYEQFIDVRRSNGLQKLEAEEVDTILIAGMGGRLMVQILLERLDVLSNVRELVLQPQSEIHLVRQMVKECGFVITNENMVIEEDKYYVMMKAENLIYHKEDMGKYDLIEVEHYYFGRLLLEQRHPILLEYLEKERKQCDKIYNILIAEPTEKSLIRQNEIMEKTELIKNGLHYFETREKEV